MEAGRKHQFESREVYSMMNDLRTSGNPVWGRTMRYRCLPKTVRSSENIGKL
jgi:hypothetical protein